MMWRRVLAHPMWVLGGFRRVWEDTQAIRPIWRTLPEAYLFSLCWRLKRARNRRFRFRWRDMPFLARPADFYGVEETLIKHEYGFVVRVLEDASTQPVVIDGGANVGAFSLYALGARPDAVVHALEPGEPAARILAHNARLSRRAGWHTYKLALWNADAPVAFANTALSTGAKVAALLPDVGAADTVPATRLDSFVEKHVSGRITVLKLDIEGAEQAVLDAGRDVLPRVDHLIAELHPRHIDAAHVMALIHAAFPYVHHVQGRASGKPLIFATRTYEEMPRCES